MRNRHLSFASKYIRILFLSVFIISLALRISLASVNHEANDPHLEVTQIILQTGKLPTWDKCWECFQPKLYHVTLAALFKITDTTNPNSQILLANLLNVLAGVLTLVLIYKFLLSQSFNPLLSLLAFSFAALNPKFIAINAQATNDSFLILFSTCALIIFYKFILQNKISYFVFIILLTALAVSIKTSGFVTFIAILLVLVIQIILNSDRRGYFGILALIYLISVLAFVAFNPLNQYGENYHQVGTFFALNIERQPVPHFRQQTATARPGILSIQDGFLTFKFFDLLAHPRIENSINGHLQHRTSLWTQLYGRAHSLNFDNWPPTWSTRDNNLFPLLRIIYVLALFPTALIILGIFIQIKQLLFAITRRNRPSPDMQLGIFPLVLLGYVVFVALYALLYRDFSTMKAVFLLPALPAYPLAFLVVIENRPRWFYYLLFGISLPLLCLYVADVVNLILRLV